MKNIFSLAFALCVTLHAYAQAPQGFNYQAVVLNASGASLSNQTVSLQLSILDSAASGVAVYVETQNPTTDTAGLFSVVIGNGTVVIGNFSTINWGKNNKFLKTEIDTAGGVNYVLMGISQMMSVPYALYANETNAGSVSFEYPDGLNHITPVLLDSAIAYTVPLGKNLYVPVLMDKIVVDGDTIYNGFWTIGKKEITPGFSEGQNITTVNSVQCFLVDRKVQWITQDIGVTPITVPIGKIFVLMKINLNPYCIATTSVMLDGNSPGNMMNPVILGGGQILSGNGAGCQIIVNGYFRDN